MIVVYGRLDDPPTAHTVEALRDAGYFFVILDQRYLDTEGLCIALDADGVRGVIVAAGQAFQLERVQGVYARPLEITPRSGDAWDGASASLFHDLFFEWLDISPALIINRPMAMQPNASKPLQMQAIGEAGFLVPETLLTNNEAEVLSFWHDHRRVVFKSSSGVRSIVTELDSKTRSRLGVLTSLPVQFQAYIPGVDIRVHVVGDRTFSARIESPAIDYRYAERDGLPVTLTACELPDALAAQCVALAKQMQLPLAGIDLRRRPDGAHVCFEVNPMPAYTYFEAHTGLPISAAIAHLLGTSSNE